MTTRQMDYNDRRHVSISHSASIRAGFQLTLGDIRELVEQTDGITSAARVTIRHESGDQREQTSGATIIDVNWSS